VLAKAEELGETVEAGDEADAVQEIKEAEARGLCYEGAEASVAMMLRRRRKDYRPYFAIVDYKVEVGRRVGTDTYAEATVKLRVGDRLMHTAAEGNGPVSALDLALRKALEPLYAAVAQIHLADYKVRILDSAYGANATTRVLIDQRNEQEIWSTVGASPNIIEASLSALVDGLEFGLMKMDVAPADVA
jgi:2-isopropylmalate synthase